MATAVKVDEDAMSRPQELQSEMCRRAGTAVTQQQLLTWLIDDACDDKARSFTDAATVAPVTRHDVDTV